MPIIRNVIAILRSARCLVNVNADEKVLNENGKVDPKKLHLITFDPIGNTYIELGEKVGNAFKDGLKIKNK